ncbi:MAG: cell division protein FtsA [Elusimicrobiota bacterium]|jgi:cell division protein FtsA
MAKTDLIAGLDIGSGKVTCVLGTLEPDGSGLRILSGASIPCRGVKGGVVINIKETAHAIRQAVEKAEAESAGSVVQGVYLGVRGKHLESYNNRGAYNIARTDKEITAEDVRAVIENAKAIPISNDREILHVIPQGFALDRQRGVPDPVGMEGSLLEVEVHIVTALSSHLNNLTKAVAEAGFDVLEPIYSALALGELVVTPEERELGALLVDLGGHSVTLAIYGEGAIRFSKELPIGTEAITGDLAHALRTNFQVAERMKLEHGVAHPRLAAEGDAEVDYLGVDGRTPRKTSGKTMLSIVVPRIEETFSLIAQEVRNSPFADVAMGSGAILSGGGAMLRGMPEAGEQILEMSVRLGLVPPGVVSAPQKFFDDATFTTAMGLVRYPVTTMRETVRREQGARKTDPRWLRKARGMFQEIF